MPPSSYGKCTTFLIWQEGYNTLVVSTDPAHSLGDALDVDLSRGEPTRIEGVGGASLYAVEVSATFLIWQVIHLPNMASRADED